MSTQVEDMQSKSSLPPLVEESILKRRPPPQRIKILTMGEAASGKSCLIKRYCEEKFTPDYISTIGIDYGVKGVEFRNHDVRLNFWDVAGDDCYYEIRNEFYKDTNVGLLVYDSTNLDSFVKLQKWLEEVLRFCKNPIKLFLVATKMDLRKELVVQPDDAKAFAEKLGCPFFSTSAVTGEGVGPLFDCLLESLVRLTSPSKRAET